MATFFYGCAFRVRVILFRVISGTILVTTIIAQKSTPTTFLSHFSSFSVTVRFFNSSLTFHLYCFFKASVTLTEVIHTIHPFVERNMRMNRPALLLISCRHCWKSWPNYISGETKRFYTYVLMGTNDIFVYLLLLRSCFSEKAGLKKSKKHDK